MIRFVKSIIKKNYEKKQQKLNARRFERIIRTANSILEGKPNEVTRDKC